MTTVDDLLGLSDDDEEQPPSRSDDEPLSRSDQICPDCGKPIYIVGCRSCAFWLANRIPGLDMDQVTTSKCARYPPKVQGSTKDTWTLVWPVTMREMWCGEWRPTPQVEEFLDHAH